ncbi:DUF1800 family protein [Collimonas pratensis]|uniref:DUF1800 domain-containing protein n=1 Tax=Collimonas pratensis TaxID=279113 RepID=UPI00143CD5BF|nr:DUF1800 domain-containing protein [Collimonas pratensis]NKI70226.1 DUF1800 family protein [Collimonas pratensis]
MLLASCGDGSSGSGSSGSGSPGNGSPGSGSPGNGSPGSGSPGSGSPGSDVPPTPPLPVAAITANQAARFLAQATFGPRQTDIDQLAASNYDSWLTAQMKTPATLQLPLIPAGKPDSQRNARMEAWWKTAITGPDQLRQRVAFALSEIFVISDRGDALDDEVRGTANYHDLLARDAFGNFRNLLEDVTLNPAMGVYLNMQGNQKPDPANNVHADENYAREVMQLFTIGLVQLNVDGTVQTDASRKPISTYSQSDVNGMARAFTGWSWNSADFFDGPPNNVAQMIPFSDYHDVNGKIIVGAVHVKGGDARGDLKLALDTLAKHPNVGPFIGRQLIQRLVASNPSPAYVARVAQVFNNNGMGTRGDLGAVVRAILLDPEARNDASSDAPSYGKLREPLLMATHLWRAFNASAASGRYAFWNPEEELGQAPFSAPSVFNFFNPRYSPPGVVKRAGLVAPEFQLVNAASITLISNFFANNVYGHDLGNASTKSDDIMLNLDPLRPLATGSNSGPLVDRLNLLLMSGQMSASMRQVLVTQLNGIDASDRGTARILDAIFLITTSVQYQIQK